VVADSKNLLAGPLELPNLPIAPLFEPEYKRNPYPYYKEWTARAPFWANVGGRVAVVAARFRDVEAVYRDHQTFSSVKPPGPDMDRFDFFNGYQDMVHTDPPTHTRLRSTVNAAFTPAAIARLGERIQKAADELVAAVAAGPDPAELMGQLARPLADRALLGVLLAMPEKDWPLFVNLSRAMGLVGTVEPQPGHSKPKAYLDAWEAGRQYCLSVIERRRHDPGDDLIGHVVRAHLEGILSSDEMFVMLIGLFVGGIGSVATGIGNAFVQLLRRPEQYRMLCENPSLASGAVEEVLRYDAPGLFNYKFASRDCEFEGLSIPADTTVYIIHQAAGFDASVYDDPFTFDVTRKVLRHLSFGYGIHVCIGAAIARLSMRAVLNAAARQLPSLHFAEGTVTEYGGWLQERSPVAVPVLVR
jgi:cytochrome P450